MELKDVDLKDRELKIKREIEEIDFSNRLLCLYKDRIAWYDMDSFEKKEMKKIRPIKKIGMIG